MLQMHGQFKKVLIIWTEQIIKMTTHLADIGIVDVLKKMNSKCLLSNSYRYSYQFKACDVQFKESDKIIRN